MDYQKIEKWTPSARTSIALHKVMGIPFNRMCNLQDMYNVPVAESTMWDQVEALWNESGTFIYQALEQLAANSSNYYVDDTPAQILEVCNKNKNLPKNQRRSCNTSVICSTTEENKQIILYVTDTKHSGENFSELLSKRNIDDGKNINMMADASPNNLSKIDKLLLEKMNVFKCFAHGRRKYHELLSFDKEYCMYFLKEIGSIYKNDRYCKNNHHDHLNRLNYHQEHSTKHVQRIYQKIDELFKDKLVEPNSALGKAMQYWINHKEGLTQFLTEPGMSLDNNLAERMFKYMILQRKNSYFFKTKKSAKILSDLTSIVVTCRQNQVNVNEYMNWIQENWIRVQKNPDNFLPWHYQEYLEVAATSVARTAA